LAINAAHFLIPVRVDTQTRLSPAKTARGTPALSSGGSGEVTPRFYPALLGYRFL
jgi:hypothetical protein